jgi:hypothetical protein
MADSEHWKLLIAAWNNVPPTLDLRPANDWTRAAWDRVYQAAINHYLETAHERPIVNPQELALEEQAPQVLLVR